MAFYVIFHKDTTVLLKVTSEFNFKYYTIRSAKAARTRAVTKGMIKNPNDFIIADMDTFVLLEKTKIVKHLLTNKDVEIKVNTPYYLDPSQEHYFSN